MKLCEARGLAHEGWVRSPTRTGGHWWRASGIHTKWWANGVASRAFSFADLDAEDWEPKQGERKPLECYLWLTCAGNLCVFEPDDNAIQLEKAGWKKIFMREVKNESD
jgi:hypothetical protein